MSHLQDHSSGKVLSPDLRDLFFSICSRHLFFLDLKMNSKLLSVHASIVHIVNDGIRFE